MIVIGSVMSTPRQLAVWPGQFLRRVRNFVIVIGSVMSSSIRRKARNPTVYCQQFGPRLFVTIFSAVIKSVKSALP